MQTDPIGARDDFNLYAYVRNDPLNKTDPTGNWCIPCVPVIVEAAKDAAIVTAAAVTAVGVAGVINEASKSEETKQNESDKPQVTPEELKKAGSPGRETKGRAEQTDMPGDRNPEQDFEDLGGSEAATKPGGVKVKELSSGQTAVLRPGDTKRGPTIEVQTKNDKGEVVKTDKLRYPPPEVKN